MIAMGLEKIDRKKDKVSEELTMDWQKDCSAFPWHKRASWPKDTLTIRTLIASPNGLGGAFLLIQHKDVFGPRASIVGVDMCCTNDFNLMFHIEQLGP